eukprot:CAMPEP_0194157986 /NCGR_PEP_ID=MMETSP0152-20130528/74156_1 /TAXON_ID=1049557 /ORGANISM="Thalassiothrix antarctica, Strain L6-D1" /LENGTH=170 /DNA_ID=CAMNT_0038866833 /DNA_START=63 /DNA_END=571 /DNA_ORIENTATION=+
MAAVMSVENPHAEDWPRSAVTGFERIASHVIDTSDGRSMGYAPLVTVDQLADFEDYAYNYFLNVRDPPFAEEDIVNSFGRGVWGVNSNGRYRETDGNTTYNTLNRIFAPVLQHNLGNKILMMNWHYEETRGSMIDAMMSCAEKRAQHNNESIRCSFITDFIILNGGAKTP